MSFRIGCGAGFQGDRIDPAQDLAERGALDVLVFECLAERTIALAQQARLADPGAGFDPLMERRLRACLPACARNGTKIVTNMGAANPRAAAQRARAIVAELGLSLTVAAVTGDDVSDRVAKHVLDETGQPASALGPRLVSANAYIGVGAIVEALARGADIVICGRASDPALFLAPLVHHFGWAMDDYTRLGRGTLIGHLLECSAQVTGGYFADPGVKDVPDLAHVGFPLAEVGADGNATLTKLPGTGGLVTPATCTEQLLYEIHDPAAYLQPDVIADFSGVTLEQTGPDRVAIGGATGRAPTGTLKVSVAYRDGWLGEGQISYAGANARARADLARAILDERLTAPGIQDRLAHVIGNDTEQRLRYATRCTDRATAESVAQEVEALYLCGPAAGGGVTKSVKEIIAIASTLIPASAITPRADLLEPLHETA
ncbi:acyclic terpene utilization AtuA family protein [Tropicibacter alexandrii]|uniref:acyclic terpene utilization AtuA family protein n=1 Tax=Tropicibacter alexandrii TaxID=2267683 RepID=UPI000EF47A69|nr:acyclic terpene utilization AtuA family protein [Tropicibacter alexandrii]